MKTTAAEIIDKYFLYNEFDKKRIVQAMEEYAVEYAKSLKEDKWISVQEKLQGMCSSCKINEVITDGYCNCCGAKQLSYSPPKTEK